MTDHRKTIEKLVGAGARPIDLYNQINIEGQESMADYPVLRCWLIRTYSDPRNFQYVTGEDISKELQSTAEKIDRTYDCGPAITAEFWSYCDHINCDQIAGICRDTASALLKTKKNGRK